MIVTKRFTLQEIANGEHQILGHKFLYFKKLKQPFMNSGVTIDKDGMAITHRIPTPYKTTRKHDPNYIVRCYYEKQNAPKRPEYQNTSRHERLSFIKSLFPEPSYGLAYKIAKKHIEQQG